jgi:hypothetical protein
VAYRAGGAKCAASFVAALAEKSIAPLLLPAHRAGHADFRTRLSDGLHGKACAETSGRPGDRSRETGRPASQTHLERETAGTQARPLYAGGEGSNGP